MARKDTSTLYHEALASGRALALYRLPGTRSVHYITGGVVRKLKNGQEAFAFAPFDPGIKPYYIVAGSAKTIQPLPVVKQKAATKASFIRLVKNITISIRSGAYGKIVAARALLVAKASGFEAPAFFDKLCSAYPAAFVSLTMIPGVGMWIGASPEILAAQKGDQLTTYSLAGTKAVSDPSPWGEKEKEEQAIVTDFIRRKLEAIPDTAIKARGPVTREAGSLKHLLTTFTAKSMQADVWQQVVKTLHPTPAVSGIPQAKSVKYIQQKEGFDRRFYAGYLGPVNRNGRTDLFVNLRCMEVTPKQLIFYAGCGITGDSDPQQEWLESERKIAVLKGLL